MMPDIQRPDTSWTTEKQDELRNYLLEHWKRAEQVRAGQVMDDYARWDKNYNGVPREKTRNTPWPRSSNIVVKLIRIFVDTFVARSLNVIFATRPLYTVTGFDRELKDALESYLNRKALMEWGHYVLLRDMLLRGNKNGTCVVKTLWEENNTWVKAPTGEDTKVVNFLGPKSRIIPFEDFMVYPVTANYLEDTLLRMHRVRYVEELVRRKAKNWLVDYEDLKGSLQQPSDIKAEAARNNAGLYDPYLRELHVAECHLEWAMGSDPDTLHSIVALLDTKGEKLVDVYFSPYHQVFRDYRPFPKEDFFWGESMCQLLQECQEEATTIHNDRRNNSYLSNAPQFKRRSGSLLPNPSSDWYPGKVWDLESMEDLEVFNTGTAYDSMLDQEMNVFQYAERLSGIGPVMQGNAAGFTGKRGVYNAMGTIALLQESNQRQDTNIRDAREVLSAICHDAFHQQALFGSDDEMLQAFPEKERARIQQALNVAKTPGYRLTAFNVETSSAGSNQEIERQNLLQIAGVLAQYGQSAQQMVAQLVNPQLNPGLRSIMLETLRMQKWMAARLLKAFNEMDAEGVLPDAITAIEKALPGGAAGSEGEDPLGGLPDVDLGGATSPGGVLTRPGLQYLSTLSGLGPDRVGQPGMASPELGALLATEG